jgi:4-diphosphocytidyl-2-C-methyl-D-erythritol kinase
MPDVVTKQAAAKLNLALAVGPPRADGMHPICSWMVTVDLHDDLEVKRLLPDRFSRYAILWHQEARRRGEIDWSIRKDLAVRAHTELEQHVGHRLPVQMKLEKRIPLGGGLGGGSADAAAMLHAVNELYELGLAADELARVGGRLGSDVPFLVHGGSAIVRDLGETIERHESLPQIHAVLALPSGECPTGRVYACFDEDASDSMRADEIRSLAGVGAAAPPPDALFNDLARPAIRVLPELEDLIPRLSAIAERPAHVTGSGSCLFIICDDPLHAQYLAEAIERDLGVPALAVQATASHSARFSAATE